MASPQLTLASLLNHNNQQLFSDHYLDAILPQRHEWTFLGRSLDRERAEVAQLFASYVPSDSEAQLEDDLVRPLLKLLGHTYAIQPALKTPDGTKKPDYVLYTDSTARDANKKRHPYRRSAQTGRNCCRGR